MKNKTTTFTKMQLCVLRGALFVLPIWLCAFVLGLAYQLTEQWLGALSARFVQLLLPASWYAAYFPTGQIPGLSLITAVLILGLIGAVASWHIGRQGLRIIDYLFLSIPGINSLYSSVRKIVDAIGEPGKSRFQKVVFVDFPTREVRTVGFVTNEINPQDGGVKRYVLFVPHMPNPTSGFVMLVDAKSVVETNMTPEEGLKYCLSLGVLAPPSVRLDKI